MSDTTSSSILPAPGTPGHARLIYWGFLLGLVLPGLNFIAAALAARGPRTGDALAASHYHNQVSIFIKSVIYVLAGLVFTYFLFGVLLIMATIVWYILRVQKGMTALKAGQPPANPDSWTF